MTIAAAGPSPGYRQTGPDLSVWRMGGALGCGAGMGPSVAMAHNPRKPLEFTHLYPFCPRFPPGYRGRAPAGLTDLFRKAGVGSGKARRPAVIKPSNPAIPRQ